MPPRERRSDSARRHVSQTLLRIGAELHDARLQHGLSQASVGAAAGITRSQVSRIEHGLVPEVSVASVMMLFAAVGLDVGVRAYPGGQPIRDRGHLALIERLKGVVGPTVAWRFEKPIPVPGDKRAWDVCLTLDGGVAAIEVETRPRDVQDLLRRLSLKLRDDPTVKCVVLLLADTRHNRALVREHADVLAANFPAGTGETLGSLGRGRLPAANGVLLL